MQHSHAIYEYRTVKGCGERHSWHSAWSGMTMMNEIVSKFNKIMPKHHNIAFSH